MLVQCMQHSTTTSVAYASRQFIVCEPGSNASETALNTLAARPWALRHVLTITLACHLQEQGTNQSGTESITESMRQEHIGAAHLNVDHFAPEQALNGLWQARQQLSQPLARAFLRINQCTSRLSEARGASGAAAESDHIGQLQAVESYLLAIVSVAMI